MKDFASKAEERRYKEAMSGKANEPQASLTPETDDFLRYLSTGVVPKDIPHSWVEPLTAHARRLEQQRDKLVKALEELTGRIVDVWSDVPHSVQLLTTEARAALAEVKGKR